MQKTERCIRLLVNDNKKKLNNFHRTLGWAVDLDIGRIYERIKDVHNSAVYHFLGAYVYWGRGSSNPVEKDVGMAVYYLEKSAMMGNERALLELNHLSIDYETSFGEVCCDILKFCRKHIELENRYSGLEEKYKELERKCERLEKENTDLRTEIDYMPDGRGYMEAKEHFTSLKD